MLCGIVASLGERKTRLVLLVDEFQRIGVLRPSARNAVLSSLRSVFSNCPRYVSVVLAIGSRIEKSAMDLLPDELKTLLGPRPAISLPHMDQKEAEEFVVGRFRYFRPKGYRGSGTAPFSPEAVKEVIEFLAERSAKSLIPRIILQALAWVYDEASLEENGEIDADAAKALLQKMQWSMNE
jgi:hypothetical protein